MALAAHLGVHLDHRTGEVADSQDIVALSSIHRNFANLVGIAIHVLYDTLFPSNFL